MITFEIRLILVFLTAFFAALFVLPKIAHIAQRIGLVDHPGKRKIHKDPKPLVGGIGMTIAATFSALVFIPIAGLRGFFLGLALLLLVGFLDDFREIGHNQKFLAQIAATTVMMYFSKTALLSFGDLLGIGPIDIPQINWMIWCVTIFCVVGVINAVNMIDGLDGLAGGLSFIAFLMFAVHASFAGEHTLMFLNLALAGAILGFLRFNWHPASLFMGDAGSLCLGFALAFMSLALTQGDEANVRPVVALLVLAVPITDTITVMLKRIVRGESPFKADRYHLHHIILRYGMSRTGAVRLILGLSILLSGCSLFSPVYNVPDFWLFLIFSVYFLLYLVTSLHFGSFMRLSLKVKDKMSGGLVGRSIKPILKGMDLFRVFRKSHRYDVGLACTCYVEGDEKSYKGTVLDISSGGFMACFSNFKGRDAKMVVKMKFPSLNGYYSIKAPVMNIWQMGTEGEYFCGFKFLDFDGMQDHVVFQLLVKYDKNSVRNHL